MRAGYSVRQGGKAELSMNRRTASRVRHAEGDTPMVMACVDVDYRGDSAVAACVLFRDWTDGAPAGQHVQSIQGIEAYVPGQFYRRELPCLLAVLAEVAHPLEVVL